MRVACAVVDHGFLLNTLLGHSERKVDQTISLRRSREHADFQRVQAFAGIAIAQLAQVSARDRVHFDFVIPESALLVGEGPVNQLFELFHAQRLQLENLGTRNQRAVHVKERIVGGGPDEAEISAFHIRQENVLLRLVEMMNLVDEHDRGAPGSALPVAGGCNHPPHLGHVAFHSAQADKLRIGQRRHDPCQGGFARAGWAGKDDGGKSVCLDGPAQQFARGEDMLLADKFVQGAWPHARGQWSSRRLTLRFVLFLFPKEILH